MSANTRIWIIGTSCSGKTTLARNLSARLGLPHSELDSLYWGPGWTPRSDFVVDVTGALEGESWIVEGNYHLVKELILSRATRVIFLDLPFPQVFWRAMARTVKRLVTRERLFNGNVETLRGALFNTQGIPMWVIRTYRRRRREFNQMQLDPALAHIEFVRLHSSRGAGDYLKRNPR